jgi:hypothetical protein
MAASLGGTLKLDDSFEWVCTSTLAEIDKDAIVQGYYHIIPTGEKREYGELHLRKLHDDYKIMVENITAKGKRHELLLALKRDETILPMEIKDAPGKGADYIEENIVPDRTETATVATAPIETGQDSIVSDYTPRGMRRVTWTTQTTRLTTSTAWRSTSREPSRRHRSLKERPRGHGRDSVRGSTRQATIGPLWGPITVSDLDEMDKTPTKSEGRSALRRRSTKRP